MKYILSLFKAIFAPKKYDAFEIQMQYMHSKIDKIEYQIKYIHDEMNVVNDKLYYSKYIVDKMSNSVIHQAVVPNTVKIIKETSPLPVTSVIPELDGFRWYLDIPKE